MINLNPQLTHDLRNDHISQENQQLSHLACKSTEAIRLQEERENETRPAFFHDTDRILHSPSYTRYIDKTQVFSQTSNDHITHRVLHVQLVAKIARVIGRALRLNEDLIEAIALGHDLGHVPFGHEGERFLNAICDENNLGCFMHNAQSVRAVMEIEKNGSGLNLSVQTMDGILCHNGELFSQEYRPDKKKSIEEFLSQYRNCMQNSKAGKKLVPMTMEGCVVRLCDIIAYIGRDVEDAIKIGLINRTDIPEEVSEILGNNNSSIVGSLVNDILNNSLGKDFLQFSVDVYSSLITLRNFNYHQIYRHPKNLEELRKVENIFRFLYQDLLKELDRKGTYIHRWAREKMAAHYSDRTCDGRIVIDYIAGMTDSYFIDQFKSRTMPKSKGYKI